MKDHSIYLELLGTSWLLVPYFSIGWYLFDLLEIGDYIGLATGFWKERYANHLKSFRHSKYSKDTRLSTHLWKLKGTDNQMPKLQWSVMKKSSPYSNISKRCMICLNEKLAIIQFEDHANLINKRNEAISKCLHQDKYLLKNYKSKD